MLTVMQIGMNSVDLAGSLRLMSEAFGFVNAGGQAIWGPLLRIQSLQDHDRALVWWLLGRQPGMQLELFQHSSPAQRPLRGDWAPNDLGWVRFGVAVSAFDRVIEALAGNGIAPLADTVTVNGLRRTSFREPYIGCIIEVMEDGPNLPWQIPGDPHLPALIYATSSVSDVEAARRYYGDTLGMTVEDIGMLHAPQNEAAWGLAGAQRTGFLAHCGGMRFEIVQYQSPLGRAKPEDYRLSDQGIVNVGLRAESCAEAERLFGRLAAIGSVPKYRADGAGVVSGYITDYEREIELIALPDEVAAAIGFVPALPFLPAMSSTFN